MAKMGSFSLAEMKKLQKQLNKIQQEQAKAFAEACAKELAARLLAKVIKRTPVGDYSGDSYVCQTGQTHKGRYVPGKVGGTLRRGWTAGNDRNAMYSALFKGKAVNPKDYVNSLPIDKQGNEYVVTIINPVEYASYVEYGHRTVNGKGWAPGHFMLTTSEQEIQKIAPGVLQAKIKKFLQECLK